MLSLPSTAQRAHNGRQYDVAISGITVGMLILGLSVWSLVSAWTNDGVQDNGEAVSGWGTPGEKWDK
jgi:hypothetical protein